MLGKSKHRSAVPSALGRDADRRAAPVGRCRSGTSSTSSKTTTSKPPATTTLPEEAVAPPPPNAASVTAYLNSTGAPLVAFVRATTQLATGTVPSKSSCQSVGKGLSGSGASSPDAVSKAIRGSPTYLSRWQPAMTSRTNWHFSAAACRGRQRPEQAAARQDEFDRGDPGAEGSWSHNLTGVLTLPGEPSPVDADRR